jgi:hypothetical protein
MLLSCTGDCSDRILGGRDIDAEAPGQVSDQLFARLVHPCGKLLLGSFHGAFLSAPVVPRQVFRDLHQQLVTPGEQGDQLAETGRKQVGCLSGSVDDYDGTACQVSLGWRGQRTEKPLIVDEVEEGKQELRETLARRSTQEGQTRVLGLI